MTLWKFYLPTLLGMAAMFSACTMSRQTQLVERSKKEVPHWTAMPALELNESAQHVKMLMVRKAMRDLPLGVKQTQFQAITNFKAQLLEQLAAPARQAIAAQSPDNSNEIMKELEEVLEKLSHHEIFNQIRIEDIYFETFASRGPIAGDADTTYDIYVLTHIALEEKEKLRELYVKELMASNSGALKRLAPEH